VDTNRKVFWNNRTAARARLRGVAWINQHNETIGVFSLIRRVLYQLMPRSISNAFVQAAKVPILHFLNIQVFKDYDLVLIHQSPAELMGEVVTAVDDALMNVLDSTFALEIFGRAFLANREFALGLRQVFFTFTVKARIFNLLAGRECGEFRQAKVYTHRSIGGRQWLRLDLTGEAGIPIAQAITFDNERLDFTSNRAMHLDPNVADLGKAKSSIIHETKPALRIGKGFIPVAFEARIPGFFAFLAAAKEMLKGQVNTGTRILQGLRVCLVEKWVLTFPFW